MKNVKIPSRPGRRRRNHHRGTARLLCSLSEGHQPLKLWREWLPLPEAFFPRALGETLSRGAAIPWKGPGKENLAPITVANRRPLGVGLLTVWVRGPTEGSTLYKLRAD